MPRFAFHVQRGRFSNSPVVEAELDDHQAAWRAGADICADLIREIVHSLSPTEPEWCVAVSDATGQTLYRFRITGEELPR